MAGVLKVTVSVLIAATTLGAMLPAQGGESQDAVLGEHDIATLHRVGFSERDLLLTLDKRGTPALERKALERLASQGVPESVLKRLRKESRRSGLLPLTVDQVVDLVRTGMDAPLIVQVLERSGSTFDLTPEQTVDLVLKGVPAPVIQYMRTHGKSAAEAHRAATSLTLEDVVGLVEAGVDGAEIIRRIRKVRARFEVVVDDLIALSRRQVPQEVITEIWNRRVSNAAKKKDPVTEVGAPASRPSKTTPTGGPAAFRFTTHREPNGGFSLIVPRAWFLHRESRGPNALLSFTDETMPGGEGLPDAEIQVFRYRAQQPERLTRANLDPIADNFLNRLKASYAAKGMTLTYGRGTPAWLSGRPAIAYRVASSDRDGSTHEGEVLVTWHDDQIFVVAGAAAAARQEELAKVLATSLRSFTIERDAPLPEVSGDPREHLVSLFETWKKAVRERDFALYRNLFPSGYDDTHTRSRFVGLVDRLGAPDARITLGEVKFTGSGAQVDASLIGPDRSETIALSFTRGREGFRLKP